MRGSGEGLGRDDMPPPQPSPKFNPNLPHAYPMSTLIITIMVSGGDSAQASPNDHVRDESFHHIDLGQEDAYDVLRKSFPERDQYPSPLVANHHNHQHQQPSNACPHDSVNVRVCEQFVFVCKYPHPHTCLWFEHKNSSNQSNNRSINQTKQCSCSSTPLAVRAHTACPILTKFPPGQC